MMASQRSPDGFQRFDINYADVVQSPFLGQGRFGRVHKYTCNGVTVAIKDIAICVADKTNRLDKLLRESTILTKLNNKNIISLHDTQEKQQNLLLVMELAAGGSVHEVLVQYGPLASNVVTNWAAQIAEGMSYLHENDVVHRDLKSRNVLVLEPMDSCLFGKTLKIADFGLACDEYDGTRTMSEPAGTFFCMAPEVREEPHRFSKASDVWSYGVVVWSMFRGEEPSATSNLISATTEEFGSLYAEILNNCWSTDPKKRPPFNWIVKYLQGSAQSEVKEVKDQQKELQEQRELESRARKQLETDVNLETQLLASSMLRQQQCFAFGTASVSVHLPVACCDVALTKDGRSLLLAAGEHGLLEFSSSSSSELSRWQPPKKTFSPDIDYGILWCDPEEVMSRIELDSWTQDDPVLAVAALSDGRAAVSVCYARCIVLLRRRDESSLLQQVAMALRGDTWTEHLRVDVPWSPQLLSAHGDVLAASGPSSQLLLRSLSGRQLPSTMQQRDYSIGSLAVSAGAVVTGGWDKVELSGGRREAYVLDAHSLADDERLWRHVLSSSDLEEKLQGIFADSSGGFLYAAVWRSDLSSGHVSVLSLADGSKLRGVALSFDPPSAQPLLLPRCLSLCNDATLSSSRSRVLLLAVLCYDPKTKDCKTVTVHRYPSD